MLQILAANRTARLGGRPAFDEWTVDQTQARNAAALDPDDLAFVVADEFPSLFGRNETQELSSAWAIAPEQSV